MNDTPLKRQLVENYLKQQQQTVDNASDAGSGHVVLYNENENITLDELKGYVKKWLEHDNFVKRAKEAIKEKKKVQDKLTQVITKFMCKYDIEDLNTKEGRIRCKTQVVKAPISQRTIKQKITDYFKENEYVKEDFIHKVYEDREKVERVSLRRLRIS